MNVLDDTQLGYFWGVLKALFVKQEPGKGLSSNDYTGSEKTKLAGIETGANNYSLPAAMPSTLGGIKIWTGTQSQYDGLSPTLKNDSSVIFMIGG